MSSNSGIGKIWNSLRNPYLGVFGLSLVVLAFVFGPYFFQPNSHVFSGSGDASKNYFTPAWYLKYDQGLHFSGMNHPHGEHIVYTDNQPAISLLLNFIDDNIFPLKYQIVGILNLLMLLSISFTALCLLGILKHYGVGDAFAIPVALALAFLAPQIWRLMGHYALAYGVYIPLVWLLALKMERRLRYGWLLLAVMVFFGLTHLYYLLMGCMMLGLQALVAWVMRDGNRKLLMMRLGIAVASFAFVYALISLTDGVADRPAAPYGFTTYRASIHSVFFPKYQPFVEVWGAIIGPNRGQWEGIGYVGFPALLIAVGLMVGLLMKLSGRSLAIQLPAELRSWVVTGFLILLFAMAIPFIWGLEFLLEYTGPLKQFRSPGRFAWVFYYLWTVSAAVLLWKFCCKYNKWRLGVYLLIAIWSFEGIANLANVKNYIAGTAVANPFRAEAATWPSWLQDAGYQAGDFEAIVSFPFHHMGSEKIYLEAGGNELCRAMLIAYELGLPLQQAMLSRTSYIHTVESVSLVADPLLSYERAKPAKPYLLLYPQEAPDLSDIELSVIELAKPIGSFQGLAVAALDFDEVIEMRRLAREAADAERSGFVATKLNELWEEPSTGELSANALSARIDSASISGERKPYYARTFDTDGEREGGISGNYGWQDGSFWTIFNQPIDAPAGSEYVFSIWMKAYPTSSAFPQVRFRQYDDVANIWLEQEYITGKSSTDVYQDWVRASFSFAIHSASTRVEFVAEGGEMGFDNMEIRPADMQVELQREGVTFFNNFPLVP